MNFSWFWSLFSSQPKYYTGVNEDPRLPSQQDHDYAHEERVAATPEDPFGNMQILQSPYPYENQFNTSSCCPHGVGLALAIERKADLGQYQRLGWLFNYRQRSNYADQGCYLQNVFDNYRHFGAPLYTSAPDVPNESIANAMVLTPQQYNEAEIFKGLNYYTVKSNFNDITTLSSIAQQGHGVAILIYAQSEEWGLDYPYIKYSNLRSTNAEIVHCICILPNSGFIKDGKKYVTIQDSAHFGAKTIRYLSEDFIKARVYAAAYWDTVASLGSGTTPKYHFTRSLRVGMSGDDVRALQQLFIAQGLLPTDCMTGYFGGRTLAALHAFQSKYANEVLTPNVLNAPTDLFGPASIAKANQLCA